MDFNLFSDEHQSRNHRTAPPQSVLVADSEPWKSCPNPPAALPRHQAPFAVRHGALLSRGQFWADVAALAETLPDRPHLFNLCEDRYLFCVTLLAALTRRQVCLLPPSGQPGVLRDIALDYPGGYLAAEHEPSESPGPWFAVTPPNAGESRVEPEFDPAQLAVIAFTSGSTGQPKPCPHRLGTFEASARMALRGLGLEGTRALVVSTTPPQHMYGLETSIFWPLFSSLALHAGRPFFPEDIRETVGTAPLPCWLASTPTHLNALARTGGVWANLSGILCSTAPLSDTLARHVEAATGAPLREIYGSTETLSFAARRPARETLWQPYPGARLEPSGPEETRLRSPHLESPARLEDRLRIEPDGRFAVLGRGADMVKIGGKRGSLADLNRRLNSIEGVRDGLLYPYETTVGECRLAAVVATDLSKGDILAALRPYLDEVFLPRRFYFVAAIPRNAVGKVNREALDTLLNGHSARDNIP
ncbi:AMP-binding protein [Methylomagnum sp.]